MKKPSTNERRIVFLFQAAHLCITSKDIDRNLCKYYVNNLRKIAKKNVVRLHIDIKRKLCKKCDMLLYPGITATVRVRDKPRKEVVVQCLECKSVKKFLCHNPEYQLWIEKPEAVISSDNQQKGSEQSK